MHVRGHICFKEHDNYIFCENVQVNHEHAYKINGTVFHWFCNCFFLTHDCTGFLTVFLNGLSTGFPPGFLVPVGDIPMYILTPVGFTAFNLYQLRRVVYWSQLNWYFYWFPNCIN